MKEHIKYECAAIFTLPFLVYLSIPSRHFLADGVVNITQWAKNTIAQHGLWGFITCSADHFLYDLFALTWAKIFLMFFPAKMLIYSLQFWNSLFGSLCAMFMFIFLRKGLKLSFLSSAIGAFALAFSGAFWRFSIDVEDIILSVLFMLLASHLFLQGFEESNIKKIRYSAIAFWAAFWSHRTAIFALAYIAIILIWERKNFPFIKRTGVNFALTFIGLSFLVSIPHILVSFTWPFFDWLKGSSNLGLWGHWNVDNIRIFAKTFFRSVLWWHHKESVYFLFAYFSMALFVLPKTVEIIRDKHLWGLILWSIAGTLFALWWEPVDPEFIIPILPAIAGIMALVAEKLLLSSSRRVFIVLLSAFMLVMLVFNFIHVAWSYRSLESFKPSQNSNLYAQLTPQNSSLLSPYFDWDSIYLEEFTGRKSVNLFVEAINCKKSDECFFNSLQKHINDSCSAKTAIYISGDFRTDARYAKLQEIGVETDRLATLFGVGNSVFTIDGISYFKLQCPQERDEP